MEIIVLGFCLEFYQHQFATVDLGQQVNTVVFVICALLVAFAFKYLLYFDINEKEL